jgi:two-component system, OmpR family, response regulator CpxR
VDDEAGPLALRRLVLQSRGYTVLTASTAEQALELFTSRDIRLVLTDHLLTGLASGAAMTAEMKRRKPSVPIAIYSGGTDVLDVGKADLFLSKLMPVAELFAQIEALISRKAHAIKNTLGTEKKAA